MSETRKRVGQGSRAESRGEDEIAIVDPVWSRVCSEASTLAAAEPALASFLYTTVLHHDRLESAMSYLLAQKLATADLGALLIRQLFDEAYTARPEIGQEMRADIVAVFDRDPASRSYVEPILYFKGFHALQAYRVTHWLWREGRESMALYLQNTISDRFAVDVHPAARIGRGVLIDHGTGVVIGETAVVEDDVSMLQGVTLGGTGKEVGDRHPKIRRGVLIGAGATVLGNIEVGAYSRIGAGAVVLTPVPPHSTAAGVPARIIAVETGDQPSHSMDHMIRSGDIVDYVI